VPRGLTMPRPHNALHQDSIINAWNNSKVATLSPYAFSITHCINYKPRVLYHFNGVLVVSISVMPPGGDLHRWSSPRDHHRVSGSWYELRYCHTLCRMVPSMNERLNSALTLSCRLIDVCHCGGLVLCAVSVVIASLVISPRPRSVCTYATMQTMSLPGKVPRPFLLFVRMLLYWPLAWFLSLYCFWVFSASPRTTRLLPCAFLVAVLWCHPAGL